MSQDRDRIDPDALDMTPGPMEEIENATAYDTRQSRERNEQALVGEREEPESMEALAEEPAESPDHPGSSAPDTLGTRADPMR